MHQELLRVQSLGSCFWRKNQSLCLPLAQRKEIDRQQKDSLWSLQRQYPSLLSHSRGEQQRAEGNIDDYFSVSKGRMPR